MRFVLVVMFGLAAAGQVCAQEAPACADLATLIRSAAIEAREALNAVHDLLPPDVEKEAEDGEVDADALRAVAATWPEAYGDDLAEALVGGAYLLMPLEAATQRFEVAASALEACAAKAP